MLRHPFHASRSRRVELSDNGRMMLGMLLMQRGGPNDVPQWIGDLLSQVALIASRLPDDFREHAIDIGLEAFAAQGRIDAGRKLLETHS